MDEFIGLVHFVSPMDRTSMVLSMLPVTWHLMRDLCHIILSWNLILSTSIQVATQFILTKCPAATLSPESLLIEFEYQDLDET